MSDYLLMLRFDIRKLVNYIVEIRRTPKKLISYFLFGAWIILVMLPQRMNRKSNHLEINETIVQVILGIFALLLGALVFFTLYSALKKLSYTFGMGDVNLLFPSPLEPQRILFWSMLKKIPISLARSVLPVLFLTPTLSNLGLQTQGVFFVYVSFVSLALLLPPLAFLVFLLSVRYQKGRWTVSVLTCSLVWLIGSWFWQVRGDFSILNLMTGYRGAGVWQFPVVGWILRVAYAAFYGASLDTYMALLGIVLTLGIVNFTVFGLAKDYYEDVLDHAAKIEEARSLKRSGRRPQLSDAFAKLRRERQVVVQGTYAESKSFLFKQIVNYRSTGFNEYFGYLTPLVLLAGVAIGYMVSQRGNDPTGWLFTFNGVIAYFLLLTSTTSPVSSELALPYIYVLPGTFYKKILALNFLPMVRFAINVLLLNLSYTLMAKGDEKVWVTAIALSLIVISVYFELGNSVILGNVLLPSSLDRKIFYPLLIFVQVVVIIIPAGLVGGGLYWILRSEVALELGIILANVGVGLLLLEFSDKLFAYIEMKEFSDS
ncbi:putative ABC exporter domain-containing protein [Desulfosporosinus sp. OT]|uniref:putative ABC exporter domain-containing protein n=1 Tax=Desulfosporosinus sp. OT TaxID=913865 RepID=UPI000223A773|nr:putative ABC exporter domain-containing protein [Desulfosporosinus sp. OT]EGW39103.1 putative membrane protein [Desulfosporosinus sp. OT]